MSTIQQAAANQVLRIANLYEQNCALKHGLPKVGGPDHVDFTADETSAMERSTVAATTTETTAAISAQETPSPGGGAVAESGSSLLRRAAPFLVTAAVGSGVPLAVWQYMKPADATPPIVQPASPKDGDLLQYLQSNGYHLPGGSQWQTK